MNRWTKRISTVWKKRSIKEQILLSSFLCSIIAAVALGSTIFIFSKKTMERNYQVSHKYNLEVSSSIIDIQLKSIVEIARTLLNDQQLKSILLNETRQGSYFTSSHDVALNHILGDLAEQSKYIQSIVIVSKQGNIHFYSKLSTQNGKMLKYHREEQILSMDWVGVSDRALGKEVFYGCNLLYDDNDNTFSMVKTLKNTDTSSRRAQEEKGLWVEDLGYLIINVKKDMFLTAFGQNDEGYVTNRYLIIDSSPRTQVRQAYPQSEFPDQKETGGNLVYFHGGVDIAQRVLHDYLQQNNETYLFSEVHNSIGDWEIVNVISKEELSRDSNYIGWITFLVCSLMLMVSCLSASRIANIITRPLEQLKKNIHIVSKGKFQIEEEFDETEIGKIGTQFKNMVNNNLDLHEKLLHSKLREKEAELLLLQSQINPHFLYNTLDSLYFMAIIERADEIAEMVLALSDTFKLSLNRGEKLIQVRDEIEKIKAYMKLQNMRYHNRFDLVMDIEESLMDKKILTFILQPLVENAVYHGLEPKMGDDCFIWITGRIQDGFMEFHIRDNGVGIENLSLLDQGYGVRNIRERIALFYGEQASLEFKTETKMVTQTLTETADGKSGTEAIVRLPWKDTSETAPCPADAMEGQVEE